MPMLMRAVLSLLLLGSPCAWADATLTTSDGLKLVLDSATGSLTSLRIDGRECAFESAPLVCVETVDQSQPGPNLIKEDGWSLEGTAAIDTQVAHSGKFSFRFENKTREGKPSVAAQTVTLNLERPEPFLLQAWSKANLPCPPNVNGLINGNVAVAAELVYGDGTKETKCQSAFGPQYSHDWTRIQAVVCPDKPVKEVKLRAGLGGDTVGALWLNEIELRPLRFTTSFLQAPLKRVKNGWLQEAPLPDAGVRVRVTYQPKATCIEVRGQIENLSSSDKAVTLRVSLPVDARSGGKWWHYARSSESVGTGVYWDGYFYGAGRMGYHTLHPWAALDLPAGKSLSLGVGLEEPQIFRLLYNGWNQRYCAEFDIGLTERGSEHGKAGFTALLYRNDPEWSFRDATARYHKLYPWAFQKRVKREGIWTPFLALTDVADWKDFGIQFNECVKDFAWESRQGVTPLTYIEPGCTHTHYYFHGDDVRTPAPALQRVRDVLSGKRPLNGGWHPRDPWIPDALNGILSSCLTDTWGNPTIIYFDGEDDFMVNPAPGISGGAYGHNSAQIELKCVTNALSLKGQYHLDEWDALSGDFTRGFALDKESPHSGSQCVRLSGEPQYAHWSPFTRGVRRTRTLAKPFGGRVKLGFWVRGDKQASGQVSASVHIAWADGQSQSPGITADKVDGTWRHYETTFDPKAPVGYYQLSISLGAVDCTAWVDDVFLGPADATENWLLDGGFEQGGWVKGRIAGVYLDTVECTQAFLNYRREHFPQLKTGLSFDWARSVVQPHIFGAYEFTREIAGQLHRDGKLLMANCCPSSCPFSVPYVDIPAQEEEWVPNGTGWNPKTDQSFSWIRAVCGTKPYCILLQSRGDADKVRRQVARCAFYAVFPSFGVLPSGPEAKLTGQYYWNQSVVDQDRPVFKKYVPVIQKLSQAGWQPVTLARSDNPDIWVERYGPAKGPCYLAFFNPTAKNQTANVSLDRSRLGLKGKLRVAAVLGDSHAQPLPAQASRFAVEVPVEETVVVFLARE